MPITPKQRLISPEGPENAPIVVLTDFPPYGDLRSGRSLSDHSGQLLWSQFLSAGLLKSHVRIESVCQGEVPGCVWYALDAESRNAWGLDALDRLSRLSETKLIITLGDVPLELLTGQKSADKWHLSVLPPLNAKLPKVLSLLHPDRCFRAFRDAAFLRLGAERALRESKFPEIRRPSRRFEFPTNLEDVLQACHNLIQAETLSFDIETGRGQITCIGLSSAPDHAVTIPTLPSDWDDAESFHLVWSAIARALQAPSRKIAQNGIYDLSYLARYGISVSNFWHDTMIAQALLNPQFPKGLDTLARIYTEEPYWKDEAKDWGMRQDRSALFQYNAKDAAVTHEIAFAQRRELAQRGMSDLFDQYLMKLASGPILEMSWRGLPVDSEEKERLLVEAEKKLAELETALNVEAERVGKAPLNPRSPKQVKEFLKALGFAKLPTKNNSESSDVPALLKLRQKRPDLTALTTLIDVSATNKEISSYLRFEYDPDQRMRYTLSGGGTETGRFACYKDPWNRGLNAQTIPSYLKTMFKAPEGRTLIEVDLKQADARVVAWDSADSNLITFYERGEDIHRFVASRPELFNCDPNAVSKAQRQLGKKVGHAANYGVSPPTLALSCLVEMNLVLSDARAAQMLEGYHRAFPGIRRWQERIRTEVQRTRQITSPTGYVKRIYDRMCDATYREAYAYRPQNIVAVTINRLILHMFGHYDTLLQTHDSGLFEVDQTALDSALNRIKDQESWNPRHTLPGGPLRIPIEIKVGQVFGQMTEVFSG